MKNVTYSFITLVFCPSAGTFELNKNILETNIINLSVVLTVLIFFGKGLLSDLLYSRQDRIFTAVQNAEELSKSALDKLKEARVSLQEVEKSAEEIRLFGYSQIKREKEDFINATSANLEQLEDPKNETICLEEQKIMEEVQQYVSRQVLQRVLQILKSRLNSEELHLRTIDHYIGLLSDLKKDLKKIKVI
nr:ATP synthase CF0 B chain [Pherosphaera fitzgeraldii]